MKTTYVRHGIALAVGLMAATLSFAQPASAPAGGMNHGAHASGGGSEQLHQHMMRGMQDMQGMKPSGDTDKDFATMMRMHHQHAVEMARVELQHGKSAELKAMSRKMIKDQQKEIAQLDKWLASRK
ncbi:DUF305 domain-containing protein [Piscinibacter koreensis]|uniref:DUF305 domain-containing protein n=1 Tax=Piscinibacter koreensis TaxID=2742824 RepID=A0A7Y6NT74_9BURK|nr:DUF305 domain-containing protein [Schlegelella koreensis]NUZ08918.1 DUF305 domain-containing protein [Schlegelella koreensis]